MGILKNNFDFEYSLTEKLESKIEEITYDDNCILLF
jgi:hypothetical protein